MRSEYKKCETHSDFGKLTQVSAEWDGALVVDLVAEVAPQQLQRLCLDVHLVVSGPFLLVYLADALHQRFGRRLHFPTAVVIIFKLFLQSVRSVLLFIEIVLVDLKQFIGGLICFSEVLKDLLNWIQIF